MNCLKRRDGILLGIFFILIIFPLQAQKKFHSTLNAHELEKAPVKLIPYPKEVEWSEKTLPFQDLKLISNKGLSSSIKSELNDVLSGAGIALEESSSNTIKFFRNNSIDREGYNLNISPGKIEIETSTEAGQFYALQTLRQLSLEPNYFQQVKIKDEPAFGIRGFMIDVGRNFQSIEALKKYLDIMSMYKLNTFQWHLTDYPAWRIESKKYPELTAAENHRPTRDPGEYYTYNDIRELIKYAKERQILIIPEIDMPGHSTAFTNATGFKMESPQGMKILEDVLQEFFEEIPKEMAPMIHLGSDEITIPNPEEFMERMVGLSEENGRQVIIWNPGLPVDNDVIRQTWKPGFSQNGDYLEIDSWNSYIGDGEPMTHIPKILFKPIGRNSKNEVIGGINVLFHDVNIEEEEAIEEQTPLFPSLLTYAWTTWTADVKKAPKDFLTMVPNKGTPANNYFAAFEDFLMAHKKRYFSSKPFPYVRQANTVWKLIGPFDKGKNLKEIKEVYHTENGQELHWKKATGSTIYIKDAFKLGGLYPEAKLGETYFALTYIYADKAGEFPFWIAFETPYSRSNRAYSGIAEKGEWDIHGGNIWINNSPLPAPNWKNPGWKPQNTTGWGTDEDQETPWRKEEMYWTRKPVMVNLRVGWNKVLIKVPGTSDTQNWMFTFAPLNLEGIKFSLQPE